MIMIITIVLVTVGGDRHGDLLRELERGDRDARNAPKGGASCTAVFLLNIFSY